MELTGTDSNREGIGAIVTIEAGGNHQMRQVEAGSGYASQHGTRLYFGLGDAAQIDALTVRWPSGAVEAYEDLKTRALVRITEGAGAGQLDLPRP